MTILYEVLLKEELKERTATYELDHDTMSIPVFKGFHYFSPIDFDESEIGNRFIVAIDKQTNEIVGVMKTKRYATLGHRYVNEQEKDTVMNYIAIRYVNTKEDWKRKGIAIGLYQKFNELVNEFDSVVGSPLSKEGKEARLNELRNTYLECKTYRSLEEYEELEEILDEYEDDSDDEEEYYFM